jgi:drug/metabolite transporter (DMT)-like permease
VSASVPTLEGTRPTSSVFLAIEIALYRHVLQNTNYNHSKLLQISCTSGAIVCICFLFLFEDVSTIQLPTINHIPTIILSGIFGTAIPALFFVMAIKRIDATRTIVIYSSNSIFAVIIAALYLSEEIQITDVISIIFIILGVFILKDKI